MEEEKFNLYEWSRKTLDARLIAFIDPENPMFDILVDEFRRQEEAGLLGEKVSLNPSANPDVRDNTYAIVFQPFGFTAIMMGWRGAISQQTNVSTFLLNDSDHFKLHDVLVWAIS